MNGRETSRGNGIVSISKIGETGQLVELADALKQLDFSELFLHCILSVYGCIIKALY